MPQRQSNTKRVEGGPQGEDAYVVMKRLTMDEQTAFGQLFTKVLDKSTEEQTTVIQTTLSSIVLEWNWVNNDGSPFPQLREQPTIAGQLYADELDWLIKAVSNSTDGQKKDLKPMPTP